MFVVVRLPMPRLGVLTLARNSLKRQQFRAIYALIALFAGVFTIGFASMVISSASARFGNHGISLAGNNLAILGQQSDQTAIAAELAKRNLTPAITSYEAQVQIDLSGNSTPLLLDGRDSAPTDLTLTGSAWGSVADGVYLPGGLPIPIGTPLTVTTPDGSTATLHVAGTYKTPGAISLTDQANTMVSYAIRGVIELPTPSHPLTMPAR